MRATAVQLSELGRRGSWSARDFLYETGEWVRVGDRPTLVTGQHGRTVYVSYVELVPGSNTPFSHSVPEPVSVFDVMTRKDARRAERRSV